MTWCIRGHPVEQIEEFCERCHAPRLLACSNGHAVRDTGGRRPRFCRECGAVFPWVRGREQRTAEENKATIHRVNVELWQGNVAILDELTTPGFYDRIACASSGIEQTKRDVSAVLAAFPDLQLASQDLIAEGDKVAAHYVLRGTHKNQFLGIPASGRQVTFSTVIIFRMSGGKIIEQWGLDDLRQQLSAA